jgi:hypothetical protein
MEEIAMINKLLIAALPYKKIIIRTVLALFFSVASWISFVIDFYCITSGPAEDNKTSWPMNLGFIFGLLACIFWGLAIASAINWFLG